MCRRHRLHLVIWCLQIFASRKCHSEILFFLPLRNSLYLNSSSFLPLVPPLGTKRGGANSSLSTSLTPNPYSSHNALAQEAFTQIPVLALGECVKTKFLFVMRTCASHKSPQNSLECIVQGIGFIIRQVCRLETTLGRFSLLEDTLHTGLHACHTHWAWQSQVHPRAFHGVCWGSIQGIAVGAHCTLGWS